MEILIGGIVVFVVLGLSAFWISTYNFFTTTKEAISTQWSNLLTEYERRVDLFMNLASTVKSIKTHEKETLIELTRARTGLRNNNKHSEAQLLGKIDNLLSGLKIAVEAYPEIKSGEQHTNLMNNISDSENRVSAARTGYNTVVREFNSYRVAFPTNMIAKFHSFKKELYYEPKRNEVRGTAPGVDL